MASDNLLVFPHRWSAIFRSAAPTSRMLFRLHSVSQCLLITCLVIFKRQTKKKSTKKKLQSNFLTRRTEASCVSRAVIGWHASLPAADWLPRGCGGRRGALRLADNGISVLTPSPSFPFLISLSVLPIRENMKSQDRNIS